MFNLLIFQVLGSRKMAVKRVGKIRKVIVYDVKEFDKILYSRAVRAVTGKAKLLSIDDLED